MTPTYEFPHTKGIVGTAANFVKHVAGRMQREGVAREVG